MEHNIALSVLVPTYRSKKHFEDFFLQLLAELRKMDEACEIVVVDDGSDDGTRDLLSNMAKKSAAPEQEDLVRRRKGEGPWQPGSSVHLRIIFLEKNVGQQQASLCGLLHAKGEVMVTMDDDLQHPPGVIPVLLNTLSEGYDLVYGIPAERGSGPIRRLGSFLRDLLFFLIFGRRTLGIRPTSFRAFRGELVSGLTGDPEHSMPGEPAGAGVLKAPVDAFLYLSAEFYRLTERIAMVPFSSSARENHHSRYPLGRLVRTFAGLALYLPIFPRVLRERFGGMRWIASEILEREIPEGEVR